MSLVKNSFSWSLGIPLGLKQVMVFHMHASHLRVWQTQLSNIASSCFDIRDEASTKKKYSSKY